MSSAGSLVVARRAYAIAQRYNQLLVHTPSFFGSVTVEAVLDSKGRNIAHHFLLDCCLCLERLRGADRKLNLLLEVHPYLKQFESELHSAGIKHTLDSSVFSPDDQASFKIIDFAVCDAANEYDEMKALGDNEPDFPMNA